jgi:predicted nucleic acid-binding protein
MGLTHLLDTSVFCQPIRKNPLTSVEERWRSLGDESLCVSVICVAEVLQGLHLKNSKKLWQAYRRILRSRLPVLTVSEKVGESYAYLAAGCMRKGEPRSPLDLLIAATARAHGLTIATCNFSDFTGIEGITVEDWSINGVLSAEKGKRHR